MDKVRGLDVQKIWLWMSIIILSQICGVGAVYGELIEGNVDDRTAIQFTSPLFNSRTNILTLNMTVTNVSDSSIFTPLKVVITGISTPDVTVANPAGYTPEGLPFFDLTPYISDKELSPGEVTPSVTISFYNPKRVKFRWDQDVLAFMEVSAERGPVIYNICLVPGEAPPKCEFYYDDPEIKNPEFDTILQVPLPEMYLYEQVRVFAYDNEGLPLRVIINGLEAGYYNYGFYYYRNLVLKDGLNTIAIEVTDEAGIRVTREITLGIDSIPPIIDILEPEGELIVTAPAQVVRGTVDEAGITHVTLTKDFIYKEEVPLLDGVFSKDITLSPGHNNIAIEATDIAGNSSDYYLDILHVYSETGTVTGKIYNHILGFPVAGAVVTAISNRGDNKTAVSGGDGGYRLEGVRSGDITLTVERDGYSPRSLKIFSPGGATPYVQDVGLIPVSTPDTFTLTGQVKDTGGHPLTGGTVTIEGASLSSISDRNGIYIITGIPRTSFIAVASHEMYEGASLNVDSRLYSSNTTILTHNFILKAIPAYIRIISPAEGEYLSGDDVLVTGLVWNGDKDVGVRVNGVLAQVYNGYFMGNDVPLVEGVNRITGEMIGPSGAVLALSEAKTILTDSVDVIRQGRTDRDMRIHAREAGIVPVEIQVSIEVPADISFQDYSIEIKGPAATEMISEGPLQHRVLISEPGIYTITFTGTDTAGNGYSDTFGFTGVSREDVEGMLRMTWTRFKDYLIAQNIEEAMSLFSPETRGRYREQFLLLGDLLPDVFTGIGDIQLVSLIDNMAKTRVYEGGITHYVWFARDIYGQWKINKF